MQLSTVFDQAKNLGKLAPAWWKHLQEEMSAMGVTTTVKTAADQAASLIAPAALISSIARSGQVVIGSSLRVLVLGRDPSFRLDSGRWHTYAADFIGGLDHFEVLTLINEQAPTSFGEVAKGVGRAAATIVTEEQLLGGECGAIDFAIWVHPVAEVADEHSSLYGRLAKALAGSVPFFACHFNELDHISQSVLASELGYELRLLPGTDAKQRPLYFNRFGIGLNGTGVRGGWGAIISHLHPIAPCEQPRDPVDVATLRAALGLLRGAGGGYGKWTLGDTLRSLPGSNSNLIGLLGDMALDTKLGRVFHLDETGECLQMIGHCWTTLLDSRPDNLAGLCVWASRLYLTFARAFPPAQSDREICEAALRNAVSAGVTEAAIGLARCLEATRVPDNLLEAESLYRCYQRRSPMAAYAVAHADMERTIVEAVGLLEWAAEEGYPLALSDYARLCAESEGGQGQSKALFERAAALGDTVACYEVAIMACNEGRLDDAKATLKLAIEVFDAVSADLFSQIVDLQFKAPQGDRARLKRERAWINERRHKIAKLSAARV